MIIGTAGHIDHGKSSLVTAITGRPMDRLAEERRRGITIDLNFAPLELASGDVAGVVDVPGHEDFVRTMVAGATGIDVVLLVVAADDGIMPQTLEHLAIVEQLGVPRGIAVITKVDLADADWVALVEAELAQRLERSPVRFGPAIRCSVVSGVGVAEVRTALEEEARRARGGVVEDLFRLPVDRAFSVAGTGTVVTGTAWSGSIAVGDQVEVLPAGVLARVRSIEAYGRHLDASVPGCRTALGLAGLDREAAYRGVTVVRAGDPWSATSRLDVTIQVLPGAPRPLTTRSRVRLHLGTAEVIARVQVMQPIEPGAQGVARLRLESPLVARGSDRFILRSYSPVTTIGGGLVADPLPPAGRARLSDRLMSPDPAERLRQLAERRRDGIARRDLAVLAGLNAAGIADVLVAQGRLIELGGALFPDALVAEHERRAVDAVTRFHEQHPTDAGMPMAALRQQVLVPERIADPVVERLIAAGRLAAQDGRVRIAGFSPRSAGTAAEIEQVTQAVAGPGLMPPTVGELEASLGLSNLGALLRQAASEGRIEQVERDRYYSRSALARFRDALAAAAASGAITPADLRDRLGISRKYLIPLLEWADRAGITVREGDSRRPGPRFKA